MLAKTEYAVYSANRILRRATGRTLHLAIEASLDIGQHIIAQEQLRPAEDNLDHIGEG